MRKLVIVESPNKIKTLRDILGSEYVVMASVGHISEIRNSGLYNMGIDPDNKFKADYVVSADKKEVVAKLKEQVALADIVYIASDPDREGEAIAWSLKKFLKIPDSKYQRVTFNDLSKKAVENAFKNTRKIDEHLVSASQARQKLDKIIGFRLSPIARKNVGARSVGRVQSAGLKILVDREIEINEFEVEYYFDLFLLFKKNNVDFKAKYFGTIDTKINRIESLEDVESIVADCKKTNIYTIKDIETKERVSNPRPPFITSTFQQEVSSRLGIGVKQSMSYAQKLFEGINIGGEQLGLITYHRTDSDEIAPEFQSLLEAHVKNIYGKDMFSAIRKGKKSESAQEGHEAIRVVDLDITPEILSKYTADSNLVKVYDIIYRRTVASAMKSSITAETIYTVISDKHLFSFSSKELVFPGYKLVYGSFEDSDDEIINESFEETEILKNTSLEAIEKQTNPPARYKEATFIKELEKRGIGRPSTFASTVETLLSDSRGYCEIQEKSLVPTQMGMTLSKFLDGSFSDIINVHYTSELEKNLDLIALNKLNEVDFLTSFYDKLKLSIKDVAPAEKVTITSDKTCPHCGRNLVVRNGKYGQFLGCPGYPKCRHIEKL